MDEKLLLDLCGLLLSAAGILINRRTNKRKKNKSWSRKWLQRKCHGLGVLNMLNRELRCEDLPAYKNFLRLSSEQFQQLLKAVEAEIHAVDTNMRQCISPRNRLELTLRFLATGESYRSLMYSTRIHETTISKLIPKVCKAIFVKLREPYLSAPVTTEEWKKVAEEYNSLWQFPNCLGALDGRHIKFKPPRSDGSYYYNYKGDHSIVLLAMADAKYKFTYVNVGVNGRISDGGVFRQSGLSKAINDNSLNFPINQALPGRTIRSPFVIVADEAFPLNHRILKPYPQRGLSKEKRIFNYRLSRARRVIENSFGILANRFRILLNPINLCVEKVELITLACVALHNFLITTQNEQYNNMVNEPSYTCNLPHVNWQNVNRSTNEAQLVREEFMSYFNSPAGAVEWQDKAILP